jgi:hypothetical protein
MKIPALALAFVCILGFPIISMAQNPGPLPSNLYTTPGYIGGGGGLPANGPGIPFYNGPNIIYASNYGVKAQGVRFFDASFTSGSKTVTVGNNTTTASDPCVTSSMIGWLFAGQDNAASTLITTTATARFSPGTTITAVASCTSFTVSNNAAANCTSSNGNSLCQVVIAPNDDGPALLTAFQAIMPATGSPNCGGKLVLPQGIMWISAPIQVTSKCNSPGPPSNGAGAGVFIEGQGIGSVLFPAPATSAWNVSTNQGAFFYNISNNSGMHYSNFTIDGAGQIAAVNSVGNPGYVLAISQNSSIQYVNIYQWGQGGGIYCAGGDAAEALVDHVNVGAATTVTNGLNLVTGSYCKVSNSAFFWSQGGSGNAYFGGHPVWSTNNTFDVPFVGVNVLASGGTTEAWSTGDTFVNNGVNQPLINITSGATVHMLGDAFLNPTAASNPVAIKTDSTPSIAYLRDSTILFNANSGKAISSAGTFYDLCGNNVQTAVANTISGTFVNCASEPSIAGRCLIASGAGPLACGNSSNGKVAIPTTTATYTINTTAVPSGGIITLTPTTDNTGIPGSPSCVLPTLTADPSISATLAGVSFTIAETSTTGITCYGWSIR